MGALKDVPAPLGPKTYRVTAPTSVFGVASGETFTREIPEVQEARLLAGGAIERVGGEQRAEPMGEENSAPKSDSTKPSALPTPTKE